ncbi:MAG: hypothetical protein PWQ70_1699 [Clostridiales bacterium]|nr:hypothetical protein [Clostridiales bacterium]
MSNLKKVLAMAVVFAMVLGIMVPAFAVPSDVVGTDYEDAAALLGALNIMVGDAGTGNFRPNDPIKRSEFAKIAVLALGLGDAAEAAKGYSRFPDVVDNHWGVGYINVAAGQGIIIGDDTGNFRPDDTITYGEAVTVLVRALGYKDEFLPGAWPANFIAKAAELDITDGVNFSASGLATRGSVAQLLYNTLNAKVIKVSTYEGDTINYYESGKTLLEDKLNIEKYENTRIYANKRLDDSLQNDEARVRFLKDVKNYNNQTLYSSGETKVFNINANLTLETLLGEEVTIYLNDDNEIIYAERENDDKAKFDYVEKVVTDSNGVIQVSLVAFDDDYKFADDAVVYVLSSNKYANEATKVSGGNNYVDTSASNVLGHVGKFVVKNNKIVYAEIFEGGEAAPWLLVKSNKDGFIKGINETDENFELDLTDDGNFDGVIVLDTMGNALAADEIEAGNIIYVQKQKYDGDDYAVVRVVTNNEVEGSLDRVKDDRISISGTEIKLTRYNDGSNQYQAFYSINNGEDVKFWNNSDWAADMEDADDETIIAYKDAVGRIAYFETEVKATSGYKYGIVTKLFNESEKIKVYTLTDDGDWDEITYALEDAKYVGNTISAAPLNKYGQKPASYNATNALAVGNVVKFKINNDGEIAKEELYVATDTWNLEAGKKFGKDSIPADNGTDTISFAATKDLIMIDAKNAGAGQDTDEFGIVSWEDMKEKDYNAGYQFYVFADDNNTIDLKAVVFIGALGADAADDEEAIYVIDKWSKGGDDYIEYVAYNGSIKEAKVDSGLGKDERAYIAKTKTDGKIQLFNTDQADFSFVAGTVYAKDGDILTIQTGASSYATYKLTSQTVIYEETNIKSASNLRQGDAVYFIVENGVNIRVIERLINTEADYVKTNFAAPVGY